MSHILKNPYVVFVITFIVLYLVFYFLGIGTYVQVEDGKKVVKTGWKYPLALALMAWAVFNFYLYPEEITFPDITEKATPNVPPAPNVDLESWN